MNVTSPRHRHTIGITRREILQVGYSGLLGLGLPALFARTAGAQATLLDRTASGPNPSPRARSMVLIFLTGAASHIDMFDLKPDAPAEIRGEFRPIATKAPGVQICEHLPRLAARADKLAIVRSMSHHENNHLLATHQVLTGVAMSGAKPDQVASRQDWPCYAGALDHLRPRRDGIPTGVTLPTFLVEGPLTWPGQHAGFLGPRHDPWHIKQDPNDANFRVDALGLPSGLTIEQLAERRTLLGELERQRADLASLADGRQFTEQQNQAFAVLTSGRIAQAFQIEREPADVRDRYGHHMAGQSLLLARRLVEAGVRMVQVNMGIVQTWDTHSGNFPRLKDKLLPPLDQGVAALVDDLSASGLCDETLVVMLGEFGRTPKISRFNGKGAPGRDHWGPCFSAVFSGAGVQGGQVIGKTDKHAAYPVTVPYSPADLAATVYRSLGVPFDAEIRDRQARPLRLIQGRPIDPLFSASVA
jgi:hypothetical protein